MKRGGYTRSIPPDGLKKQIPIIMANEALVWTKMELQRFKDFLGRIREEIYTGSIDGTPAGRWRIV